jgi:hypothetical protein
MESFGIAPELVDLMASNEILLLCVSGSSNTSISNLLNIEEDAVKDIITTIFDFDGWKEDLEFSPYRIFEESESYLAFVGTIAELRSEFNVEPNITIDDINVMYLNCQTYSRIEDQLEQGWV